MAKLSDYYLGFRKRAWKTRWRIVRFCQRARNRLGKYYSGGPHLP